MRRKNQKSMKHHPTRYLRYKGCFGGRGCPPKAGKRIHFPHECHIGDDKVMKQLFACIEQSLSHSDAKVDFLHLKVVEIHCGVILKAYADEFRIMYPDKQLDVIKPEDKKSEAILRFLGVLPSDGSHERYPDLKCWRIEGWGKDDENQRSDVMKSLAERFVPETWKSHEDSYDDSRNVATAVFEMYNNCNEHAYNGEFGNVVFRRWYVGVGEYPESNDFTICVYDKGQGFKRSMRKNVREEKINVTKYPDSYYLQKATEGYSGKDNATRTGRGKGIPETIEQISNVGGTMEIWSGRGIFSFQGKSQFWDRKTCLKGALVTFRLPIERNRQFSGGRLVSTLSRKRKSTKINGQNLWK